MRRPSASILPAVLAAIVPTLGSPAHARALDGGAPDADGSAPADAPAQAELEELVARVRRLEAARDFNNPSNEPIFWPAPWVSSGTATVDYRPHERVSFQLEYRHDHAGADMYFGGDVAGDGVATPFVANRALQDTLTIGATTWFQERSER